MQKKNLSAAAITLTILLFVTGCTGYNQLIKSTDADLKYRKAVEYYGLGKYQRTIQLLEGVTHILRGSDKDDSVAYYMAAAYYKNNEFEASSILLDNFRKTYTNSPFLEDVEYMYAMGFYYQSPPPNRDQTATNQAIVAIGEYLNRYPNSVKKDVMEENMELMIQKLHDKALINAKTYYTIGRYKAAVMALKNALAQYPDTNHREEIMYMITKSSYLLASNSIEELMRDRYLGMMDSYYSFVGEYPESKYIKELTKMQVKAKEFTAKYQDGEAIMPKEEPTPKV